MKLGVRISVAPRLRITIDRRGTVEAVQPRRSKEFTSLRPHVLTHLGEDVLRHFASNNERRTVATYQRRRGWFRQEATLLVERLPERNPGNFGGSRCGASLLVLPHQP